MKLPLSTARIGLVVAGMLGTAGAVAMATAGADGTPATSFRPASSSDDGPGDISGPCDEAEHADDPRCAGVATPGPTAPTSTTMGNSPAPSGAHTIPTPGGTVAYTVDGNALHLVSAVPAAGWDVEVEQQTGREIELDFRSGTQRVQVNIELEDGHARERVRLRDDADGTDVRVDDHGGDDRDHADDNSGPGSDNSGPGSGSGSDDSGHSGPDDSGHSGSDD